MFFLKNLLLTTVIIFIVLSFSLVVGTAFSGQYRDSAHGSGDYGVLRKGLDSTYARGNCAHCHEQHASIDGVEPSPPAVTGSPSISALFHNTFNKSAAVPYRTSDLFCFYCHSDSTESIQSGFGDDMKNYDYSRTFGLYKDGAHEVDDIMEAFNLPATSPGGSNHNLLGMQKYAAQHFSEFFGPDSDPCTACHNPHIVRRNKKNLCNSSFATISLPSDHQNHWGDDDNEQMANYVGARYQAPFTYGSTVNYEPAACNLEVSATPESLMPDYNTFCLECHSSTAPAVTMSENLQRPLKQINWGGSGGDTFDAGDKHGKNLATGDLDTKPPYDNVMNLVVSCCDCHEPHGSPYATLVRRSINGEVVGIVGAVTGDRGNQCRQCHYDDKSMGSSTIDNTWEMCHHGGGRVADNPYLKNQSRGCGCHGGRTTPMRKIPCEDCHGHGKFISGSETTPVFTATDDGVPTLQHPAPYDGVGRKTF